MHWFATTVGFPMESRRASPPFFLLPNFLLSKSQGESTELLLPSVCSPPVASSPQSHCETSSARDGHDFRFTGGLMLLGSNKTINRGSKREFTERVSLDVTLLPKVPATGQPRAQKSGVWMHYGYRYNTETLISSNLTAFALLPLPLSYSFPQQPVSMLIFLTVVQHADAHVSHSPLQTLPFPYIFLFPQEERFLHRTSCSHTIANKMPSALGDNSAPEGLQAQPNARTALSS